MLHRKAMIYLGNISLSISEILMAISLIVSIAALLITQYTQRKIDMRNQKQITIESFQKLQEEVLDKLVDLNRTNAKTIVENMEQPACKEAYNAYRTLVARLEHFSVGVNEKVYDYKIVCKLAGHHLVHIYEIVKPIIDYANRVPTSKHNYSQFEKLIGRLIKEE